jgi:hypothetical protein
MCSVEQWVQQRQEVLHQQVTEYVRIRPIIVNVSHCLSKEFYFLYVAFLTAGATQISSISETTTNSACGCSTSSCDSNDTIMAAAVPSICLTLVIAVIVIITRRRIAILKNEVMKSRNETRGSLQMTNKVCGQSHSSPHEMESYMRSSSAYALSVVAASKFEESNYEEIPHIREYNDPTYESVEKTD